MAGPLRTLTLIVRLPSMSKGVLVAVGGSGVALDAGVADGLGDGLGEGAGVADGCAAAQAVPSPTRTTSRKTSRFIDGILLLPGESGREERMLLTRRSRSRGLGSWRSAMPTANSPRTSFAAPWGGSQGDLPIVGQAPRHGVKFTKAKDFVKVLKLLTPFVLQAV